MRVNLDELRKVTDGYKNDLSEKDSIINSLNKDIKIMEDNYKVESDRVAQIHTQKLDRIKEKSEFDIEKALLIKDREYQDLINKINQSSNEKVRELLQENQIYNERVSKLMEENQLKINELVIKDAKLEKLNTEIETFKNKEI